MHHNTSPRVVVARLLGAAVGLALLWAGFSKVSDLPAFQATASQARLFSTPPWPALALVVPAAEIVVGLHLLVVRPTAEALMAALILSGVFLIYQLLVMAGVGPFGTPSNDCGCFAIASDGQKQVQLFYVLRALLFVLCTGYCLGFTSQIRGLPEPKVA